MTMSTGAIDTPDFQHGVISAQRLLGVIPAGQTSLTVDVPVNAETVVAMIQNQASREGAWCQGAASGMIYPSGAIVMSEGDTSTITVWFDVSAAVDSKVTINLFTVAAGATSIYGDSAVHTTNDPLTVDVLQRAMPKGTNALYTIPTAPNADAGDHPPNELQVASKYNQAALTVVIAAPGVGKRLRLFTAQVLSAANADLAYLYDLVSGAQLAFGRDNGAPFTYGPSGLALSTNAGVAGGTTAGNFYASVTYTTETV